MSTDRRDTWFARAPYPVKVVAAGARGAALRHQRYGRGAEARVRAALERDRWSAEQWATWQQRRHVALLTSAATHVAFYREWFDANPGLDPSDPDAWPVVTKADLQREPERFVATDAPKRLVQDHTSGTSGTPLTVVSSLEGLRSWFALYEARARRWHGVSRHDRWAILGGRMVAPPERDRPPYWVWNPGLRQLYLAANCLRPANIGDYVRAMERHRPTHVVAYPSSLAYLARLALDLGLSGAGPRVVIANAEPVLPSQREVIEAFFGCPVRETYGMAEMVAGASECEIGTLHQWPDAGILEVLDDHDRAVPAGGVGRLVATGLVNDAVPLIRYDLGDLGSAPDPARACRCGRSLPALPEVQGRSQDMISTPGGARVFWLNPVFRGLPVAEAQVVQESVVALRVLVVPLPGYGLPTVDTIRRRVRARVGAMEVAVDTRNSIERGPSGKFRPIISRV